MVIDALDILNGEPRTCPRTFNYFNKLLVLAGGVLISLHMEFRLLSMSDYLQGVVN